MRKMKSSENDCLGLIPADWDAIRLKYFCKISNGSDPVTPGDIPVYGSGKDVIKYCGEYKEGPAILLGRKGTLDKPKYIEGRFWNVDTAMDAYPINGINPRFLYFVTTILDIPRFATTTAKPSMTQSDYYNMPIPIPSNKEQQEIVDYIENTSAKIDEAISRHEALIEKLEEYRKSVITKSVTKGLNPDVEMKVVDSPWISEIPTHWDYVPLKTLFKVVDERNSDPNAILLSLYTSIGVKPRSELESRGNKAVTVINYKKVHPNDVIVNKLLAWMGAVAYSDYEGVTSPDYDVYRQIDGANANKNFYHNYFRYTQFKEDCYVNGHGIMLMRWRTYPYELLRIKVPNPPEKEQAEIGKYIYEVSTKIDEAISRHNDVISKLQEYRKSIIYQAVTGKIDCRKDKN